jgi:hypothetical protein
MSGGDLILFIIAIFAMYYLLSNISCSNITENYKIAGIINSHCDESTDTICPGDLVCKDGIDNDNGRKTKMCLCKGDYVWDSSGLGGCNAPVCNRPNYINDSFNCVPCEPPNYINSNGKCVPCPTGEVPNQDGTQCVTCSNGNIRNGICYECPKGSKVDKQNNKCKCPRNFPTYDSDNNTCSCLFSQLFGRGCQPL